MQLPDLKELTKLIDLCRKKGVSSLTVEGISLTLTAELPASNYKKRVEKELVDQPEDPQNPYANFPQGMLTPEQLMYYSAGGLPENESDQ